MDWEGTGDGGRGSTETAGSTGATLGRPDSCHVKVSFGVLFLAVCARVCMCECVWNSAPTPFWEKVKNGILKGRLYVINVSLYLSVVWTKDERDHPLSASMIPYTEPKFRGHLTATPFASRDTHPARPLGTPGVGLGGVSYPALT